MTTEQKRTARIALAAACLWLTVASMGAIIWSCYEPADTKTFVFTTLVFGVAFLLLEYPRVVRSIGDCHVEWYFGVGLLLGFPPDFSQITVILPFVALTWDLPDFKKWKIRRKSPFSTR